MQNIIKTLKKNEGDICVTLVISGKPKAFNDKQKALVKLRKSIAGAGKIVNAGYGEANAKVLTTELNNQLRNLDFSDASESLVMYATEGFATSVWLPFPEKERVTILTRFDVQPLIDCLALKRKYWVLALSKNKTRLFRGENDHLTEVVDDKFPLAYEEQFEYEKQHYSLSYKYGAYSPNNSKTPIARFHAFIRHIDHLLVKYMQTDNLPIVLLGVTSNLSTFINASSFSNRIANTIKGNFDYHTERQIAKKVWTASEAKLYKNTNGAATTTKQKPSKLKYTL